MSAIARIMNAWFQILFSDCGQKHIIDTLISDCLISNNLSSYIRRVK